MFLAPNKFFYSFSTTPKRDSLRREKLPLGHISDLQEKILSRMDDINRNPLPIGKKGGEVINSRGP